MMKAVLCAFALACVATAAQAHPFDRFAGQTNPDNGITCDPGGSTLTISECGRLYVRAEEAALDAVSARLLEKAQAADAESHIPASPGYVESFQQAQDAWRAWRNRECDLANIDSVGGSIQRIRYPLCLGNMTSARRQQLEALLALWNDEFRVNGDYVGTGALFPPNPAE